MNRLLRICPICLFVPFVSFSQSLSPAASKVKQTFNELNAHPQAKEAQLAYLNAFPTNNKLFMEVFQPKDFKQLYNDSYKYIEAFVGLAKIFRMK